ncbi:hypothetical protein ACFFGV_20015 [Pontibacillus salicampi]|uniref:Uncharacterized protein n=1 Tax=Pontibacillus salicampi TaxID=1449801 RepID=A0ABV6LTX8_9BACI
MTIYQQEPNSGWFFDNFFNGNNGLFINPSAFLLNVLLIYGLWRLAGRVYKKLATT